MNVFNAKWNVIATLIMGLFFTACAQKVNQTATGNYFSIAGIIQKEFSKTDNYVCKIYAAADYVTYKIPADSQMTLKQINQKDFEKYEKSYKTESSMGTATLLQEGDKTRTFLSSYHIFNYPDTLFNYYYREDGTKTPYISHYTVKENQIHFLKKYSNTQLAEIIAYDAKKDIAFLKTQPENDMLTNRFGKLKTSSARQMQTGKEVFITGYPNGYKMVTRGLMSKPFTEQPDKIMIDATFNKGYSGAPFFILSSDCKCFKFAGIITSSASVDKNILVPEFQRHQKIYDPSRAYKEPVYVKADEQIKYGITFTASLPAINDFYINNQQLFNDHGVNLDDFFNADE